MTNASHDHVAHGKVGLVLHGAARYDLLVWLLTFGRERAFRERIVGLARLHAGEAVLDVGCGTGSVAIVAKRLVGPAGEVCGVDASPEMIARAALKARKAGVDISFTTMPAQALPFPNDHFDVALTTLMLHHLSRPGRQQCIAEMKRVLKPGGRVLAVDFANSAGAKRGVLAHFGRHGNVELSDIVGLFREAGLNVVDSGPVGTRDLHFALAIKPALPEV